MGAVLCLTAIGERTIAAVIEDPALVWRIVAPDDPQAFARAVAATDRASFVGRIFGARTRRIAAGNAFTIGDGEGDRCELGEAWHGIHYLLTGTDWGGAPPIDFLVAGGTTLGKPGCHALPIRVIDADYASRIHESFVRLDERDLRRRYDVADMTQKRIQPERWEREQAAGLTFLLDHVALLGAFLERAVGAGHGFIVHPD